MALIIKIFPVLLWGWCVYSLLESCMLLFEWNIYNRKNKINIFFPIKLVKPIISLLVLKLLKHGLAVCSNDKYQDMVLSQSWRYMFMYIHDEIKLWIHFTQNVHFFLFGFACLVLFYYDFLLLYHIQVTLKA